MNEPVREWRMNAGNFVLLNTPRTRAFVAAWLVGHNVTYKTQPYVHKLRGSAYDFCSVPYDCMELSDAGLAAFVRYPMQVRAATWCSAASALV